jgi:hypothetical protein
MNGIKVYVQIFEHVLYTQLSYRDICLILHYIDVGNLNTYSLIILLDKCAEISYLYFCSLLTF